MTRRTCNSAWVPACERSVGVWLLCCPRQYRAVSTWARQQLCRWHNTLSYGVKVRTHVLIKLWQFETARMSIVCSFFFFAGVLYVIGIGTKFYWSDVCRGFERHVARYPSAGDNVTCTGYCDDLLCLRMCIIFIRVLGTLQLKCHSFGEGKTCKIFLWREGKFKLKVFNANRILKSDLLCIQLRIGLWIC